MLCRRALVSLAALVLVLALAAPATANAACRGANARLDRGHLGATARTTLCLLNTQRRRHGLHALRSSKVLEHPSARHSRDMVRRRYFAHGAFLARLRPYYADARAWRVGENIAWGAGSRSTPAAIVAAWMHSPPHRENILDPTFREIGLGVVAGTPVGGSGGTWTTDFGMRR